MRYDIRVLTGAERDIVDIYWYILENDAPRKAAGVMAKIRAAIVSLAELPFRGHVPQECREVGLQSWREIFFKPYRIVYEVIDSEVVIILVTDGRRDFHQILNNRILDQ